MTGTSSQESYELTAGWDTSALQPAPTNINSRKQSLLAVSALFLSIETKQTNFLKSRSEAYLRFTHFRMLRLDLPDLEDLL